MHRCPYHLIAFLIHYSLILTYQVIGTTADILSGMLYAPLSLSLDTSISASNGLGKLSTSMDARGALSSTIARVSFICLPTSAQDTFLVSLTGIGSPKKSSTKSSCVEFSIACSQYFILM